MNDDRPSNWRIVGLAIPRGAPSRLPLRCANGQAGIGLPALIRPAAIAGCESSVPLSYNHRDEQELAGVGALRVRVVEQHDGWWVASEPLPDDGEGPFLLDLLRPRFSALVTGLSPALMIPEGGWHEVRAHGGRIAEVFRCDLVAVSLVLKPEEPCFNGTHVCLVPA